MVAKAQQITLHACGGWQGRVGGGMEKDMQAARSDVQVLHAQSRLKEEQQTGLPLVPANPVGE